MKKTDYLIFNDGDLTCTRMLKPGFRHILILSNDGYNWIVFNPAHDRMEYEILPVHHSDNILETAFRNDTILSVSPNPVKQSIFLGRPCLMTCVTAAKYYLGIKCWSFTPYQLYSKLLFNDSLRELLNVKLIKGEGNGW